MKGAVYPAQGQIHEAEIDLADPVATRAGVRIGYGIHTRHGYTRVAVVLSLRQAADHAKALQAAVERAR